MKIAIFTTFFIMLLLSGINYARCQSHKPLECRTVKQKKDTTKQNAKINKYIQHLRKKGYFTAAVDSIDQDQNITYYFLHVGPQYYLSKININKAPNPILKHPHFRPKKAHKYNYPEIEAYELKLINTYQNNGYPFAKINKSTTISPDHKITHFWSIKPGNYYTFATLNIDSINLLEKKYIAGLTGIKPNKKYQQKLIDEFENKINNSGLYSHDSLTIATINNKVKITPHFTKTPNNTITGLVGIQTSNTNKTTITGQFEINTNNILKTGEHIYVNWQKTAPESQLIDASTKFSYIFSLPIGLWGQLNIDKHDSTYFNKSSKTGFLFFLNSKINLSSYFSAANYESETEKAKHTSKQKTYGLMFKVKYTNHAFIPSKGLILTIDAQTGNRIATTKQNITLLKLNTEAYIPLLIGTLKVSEKAATIINDSITTYEFFQIGGTKSIRGFNEKSIFAKSYYINSFEYIIKIADNSYIQAFYDFGISSPSTSKANIDTRNSIGTGLLIQTKAGIINLMYAIGQVNNQSLNYNNGVIHIGYSARF